MNIDLFTTLTGLTRLPADRQYWTLANEQPDEPGAEINQLVEMGFLKKSQFYGVDLDQKVQRRNKKAHPTARWITGEWLDKIGTSKEFNPSLIYLDTLQCADTPSTIQLLVSTMTFTPPGTVLLINTIARMPRATSHVVDCNVLVDALSRFMPSVELACWRFPILSFGYRASSADMRTYAFYREN